MTIVNFNSTYLDNNICPSVKNAKDDLSKAKKQASALKVPWDYQYYKYLSNLDDKINGYMKDLDRFNKWVSNSKKVYKDITDKYEDKLNDINNYSIKKHNKI